MSTPAFCGTGTPLARFGVALAVLAMSTASLADTEARTPEQWRAVFEEPDAEIEHLAGAAAGDGGLWLVVGRRAKGELGGRHEVELWRLDDHGRKTGSWPMARDGAPAIQSQRPMAMLASGDGVHIAMQTDDGAIVVHRAGGSAGDQRRPAPAASESVLIAMSADTDGQPALMTNTGLLTFDKEDNEWATRWQPPVGQVMLAATPAGDRRFGVLLGAPGTDPVDMTFVSVSLAPDGEVAEQSAGLAPGSPFALGKSVAPAGGGFVVADPFASDDRVRWRLTTLDASLNLVGSADVDLPPGRLVQTRLAAWGDVVWLLAPHKRATGWSMYAVDRAGVARPLPQLAGNDGEWRITRRLQLIPFDDGDACVVESAHRLAPDARTMRSQINVVRLGRPAASHSESGATDATDD